METLIGELRAVRDKLEEGLDDEDRDRQRVAEEALQQLNYLLGVGSAWSTGKQILWSTDPNPGPCPCACNVGGSCGGCGHGGCGGR